jgi:putative ATP-binding cassette transporter
VTQARTPRQELALFFRTAGRFWQGPTRWPAWGMTALLMVLVGGQMTIQVAWTAWGGWFYDALQSRSEARILVILPWLPGIVLGFMLCATGLLVGRMALQQRWRATLTGLLLDRWLSGQAYYRLSQGAFAEGTPEFRIAEDVRLAVEPLVELAVGLLTAVLGAVVFAQVLWRVGGTLHLSVGGLAFGLPGYLVIAAALYAAVATRITTWSGRRLSGLVAGRNDAEAKFRAELTRLRENAESIALDRGDAAERRAVGLRYAVVVQAWRDMIRASGFVALGTNGNIAFSPVVPLLLSVPGYLDGSLSIGAVAQIAGAFAATQTAAAWLADNYLRVSDVMASVSRVNALILALDDCEASTGTIAVIPETEGELRIESLQLRLPDGTKLAEPVSLVIRPGERVLLTGASGTGKSTLIRAVAGLWRWGEGRIALPLGARMAFVPQRIYLPNAPLRDVLLYATGVEDLPEATLRTLMRGCGLAHLTERLDDTARWDQMLSGGERQRIAFLRVMIARPDVIVMDESTSALDEPGEAALMAALLAELPHATLISVGHRPGLVAFHARQIRLGAAASGGRLLPQNAVTADS